MAEIPADINLGNGRDNMVFDLVIKNGIIVSLKKMMAWHMLTAYVGHSE